MKSIIKTDSHVVRKERCPECAKLGNDRSGDNLAIYNDGHTYCYRCGYGNRRTKIILDNEQPICTDLTLPSDVDTNLPYEAKEWLRQYELSRLDLQSNNVLWSESMSRIIFPYWNETGLIAWQGRYVKTTKETEMEIPLKKQAKWYSQGKIHEILHPIKVNNRQAVLVEDIISGIKVSKFCGAIPIFGSSVSIKQLLRIKLICDKVMIWLDPDMRKKSLSIAKMCELHGLTATVIFTNKDPKEHTYDEISRTINSGEDQTT